MDSYLRDVTEPNSRDFFMRQLIKRSELADVVISQGLRMMTSPDMHLFVFENQPLFALQ